MGVLTDKSYKLLHWPILLVGWLFVIYEYAIRVSDSVILPELQRSFHLSAFSLSVLSSGYYVAYIVMMVPAGWIIDRLGLKKAWLISLLIVVVGCGLFSIKVNFFVLIIARVLMGIGSAFAVIGVFSVVIGSERRGLLIGLTMAICMLGVVLGEGPWLQFTNYLGTWNAPYWFAALFGVVLCIACYYCVENRSTIVEPCYFLQFKTAAKLLLKSRVFWVLVLFIGCLSTPQTVFMALWGPHYLVLKYHVSGSQGAYLNSLTAIGGVLGGIVLGGLSDCIKQIKYLLIPVSLLTAVSFFLVLQAYVPSIKLVIVLLVTIGFLTNANTAVFAFLGKNFSQLPKATVQGAANVFNMGGGPVFQLLIGGLMAMQAGAGAASLNAIVMQRSLYLIPISLIGMVLLLMAVSIPASRN